MPARHAPVHWPEGATDGDVATLIDGRLELAPGGGGPHSHDESDITDLGGYPDASGQPSGKIAETDGADGWTFIDTPAGGGGGGLYLTDADATGLTWHEADRTTITSQTYHTIFDITSGGAEMLSASMFGHAVGFRLTIDGTVVLGKTNLVLGNDSVSNTFSAVSLPMAKAEVSMKLEIYNRGSQNSNYGWRVLTR